MTDIFISYAHEDAERIQPLVRALENQDWLVFWDRRIPTGQTWRTYIGQALADARCVIVAWSADSIHSTWVAEEADEGKKREILVPILLDDIEPPIGFRSIQAANLTDWREDRHSPQFDQFVADIAATLKTTPKLTSSPKLAKRLLRSRRNRTVWVTSAVTVAALAGALGYYAVSDQDQNISDFEREDQYSLLHIGSQGAPVALFQKALKEKGFFTGEADGLFGPSTQDAIKDFQEANGIPADGLLGRRTVAVLMKTGEEPSSPSKPSNGYSLVQIQKALKDQGYIYGPVDGSYGAATKAAIGAFQKDHGISQEEPLWPVTAEAIIRSVKKAQ